MLKIFTAITILGLLLSVNTFASISTRTEMKRGIRTHVCIHRNCRTFDGALGATLSDKTQGQNYILEVRYSGDVKKLFDWKAQKFIE